MVKVRKYKRKDGTSVVSHNRSSPETAMKFKAGDTVKKKSAGKKKSSSLKDMAKKPVVRKGLYESVWDNNKGVFYRGTNGSVGVGLGVLGNGVYFTWREGMARAFADISVSENGGEAVVKKYLLPRGLKILDFQSDEAWLIRKGLGVVNRWDKVTDSFFATVFTQEVKDKGYDGVISDDVADGLVVFDFDRVVFWEIKTVDGFEITQDMRWSYGRSPDSDMIKTDKDIVEREKIIDWIMTRVQACCFRDNCVKNVSFAKRLMRERMGVAKLNHSFWSHLSSDKSSGLLFAEQRSDPSEAIVFVDVDYLISHRGNRLGGLGKSVDSIKELVRDGVLISGVPFFSLNTNEVGEGNHRVEALKELGYKSVPVNVVGGWGD